MSSQALLQGILPIQGLNLHFLHFLHCRQIFNPLNQSGRSEVGVEVRGQGEGVGVVVAWLGKASSRPDPFYWHPLEDSSIT